jgi:CHAD domain-containing protein
VKRLDREFASLDSESPDTVLHEFRKNCKRARYLCEFAAPVLGKKYSDIAKKLTVFQDILGKRNDLSNLDSEIDAFADSSPLKEDDILLVQTIKSRLFDEMSSLKKIFFRKFRPVSCQS